MPWERFSNVEGVHQLDKALSPPPSDVELSKPFFRANCRIFSPQQGKNFVCRKPCCVNRIRITRFFGGKKKRTIACDNWVSRTTKSG
jgi:hypothetical protein